MARDETLRTFRNWKMIQNHLVDIILDGATVSNVHDAENAAERLILHGYIDDISVNEKLIQLGEIEDFDGAS